MPYSLPGRSLSCPLCQFLYCGVWSYICSKVLCVACCINCHLFIDIFRWPCCRSCCVPCSFIGFVVSWCAMCPAPGSHVMFPLQQSLSSSTSVLLTAAFFSEWEYISSHFHHSVFWICSISGWQWLTQSNFWNKFLIFSLFALWKLSFQVHSFLCFGFVSASRLKHRTAVLINRNGGKYLMSSISVGA